MATGQRSSANDIPALQELKSQVLTKFSLGGILVNLKLQDPSPDQNFIFRGWDSLQPKTQVLTKFSFSGGAVGNLTQSP